MVRLSCGVQYTRITLFSLNILFLLFSLCILALGIYIKVNGNFDAITAAYNITQALGSATMQWIGTIMIIVGSITCCLATFGCFGALNKNRFLLYTYALMLSLIILLEFATVIVVLRFRNKLWHSYDSGFEKVFYDAYYYHETETIKLIEQLEREFKCCGVEGAIDYNRSGFKIPPSCYPSQSLLPNEKPFSEGCANAIAIWVWNKLPIIAVVLGSILFVELFGVISSLVLGVAISHSSTVNVYYKF